VRDKLVFVVSFVGDSPGKDMIRSIPNNCCHVAAVEDNNVLRQ
jgi:hypothetical protein